jgi:hypothetical protein
MSKTIPVYGVLLVLALGASWSRYTSDEAAPEEGVVLVEGKKDELQRVVYDSPDVDVTFELRADDFGRYGWATVTEIKKKKVDGVETTETKTSSFKTGTGADALVEGFAPMMAVRELDQVDDGRLTTFGLKEPETHVEVTSNGGTTRLALGGETYGTKDRYVRDSGTQRVYIVDDEVFKALKFATTRLPERALTAAKVEAISEISLGQGANDVRWSQKNRDDRAAAYWERDGATGKDETFGNWLDKFLKVKSTGYVQQGDTPADATAAFDLTVRADGAKPETVRFLSTPAGDWYAQSESTRGMVKLPKGAASDAADEVGDVLEGKAPAAPTPDAAGAAPGTAPNASSAPDPAEGAIAPPPARRPGLPPVPPRN